MKKTKILCCFLAVSLVLSLCSCSTSSGGTGGSGGSGSGGGQQGGGNNTSTSYTKVDTQTINGVPYDIVEFGHYPQSEKAAGVTITNEGNPETVNGNSVYTGSDGAYYVLAKSKYYKVEPIRWRVLTDSYDHDNDPSTPGKKLLLAEKILEPMIFYDDKTNLRSISEANIFPNNYQHSKIRAYLNGLIYNCSGTDSNSLENKGFLQRAFTSEEQSLITETKVVNNAISSNPDGNATQWNNGENTFTSETVTTSDKIFLLSEQEVTKAEYGFAAYDQNGTGNTRIRITTDFAKINGAFQSSTSGNGGFWWLRSPNYNSNGVRFILATGKADSECNVDETNKGIVPALCLN